MGKMTVFDFVTHPDGPDAGWVINWNGKAWNELSSKYTEDQMKDIVGLLELCLLYQMGG